VDDLQNGIAKISKGDLIYKIPEIAQDEFGQLAKSFNRMSVDLKTSYKNLRKLNEISQRLSSVVQLELLLQVSVEQAFGLVNLDMLAVLFKTASGDYCIEASLPDETFKNKLISKTDINSLLKYGHINGEFTIGDTHLMNFHSTILFPLREGGKIKGMLLVCRNEKFLEHETDILQSMAQQIEISMSNIIKLQLQSEIETAKLVQEALIPQLMPNVIGMDVFGTMYPAKGIGGDYFDFIVTRESELNNVKYASDLWMVLGDVSGKGVSAGLIMVMVRTFLHSLAGVYNSVIDLMLRLNDFIYENSDSSRFMSAILGKWNAAENELKICGAGHEKILIYSKKNNQVNEFDAGGMILGIAAASQKTVLSENGIDGFFKEYTLNLESDDFVMVFTDGVTEARNMQKEEYGLQRVKNFLYKNTHKSITDLVNGLYESINKFSGGALQHDDVTILGFRRKIEKEAVKNLV
jgi:serine phosphatase RsbU (regulator of sigma subunit)